MFVLQTGPGRAGDDFARLRLNVAEANFLVFLVQRQMAVIAAGDVAQGLPGFTATWPLVSGASDRITSAASIALSIFGRPAAGPSALT